jgi:hypothetical protein
VSEIASIVGLYGAIDRVVQGDDNASRRADVATLLTAYRDPATRWFDEFERWTLSKRAEDGPYPFASDAVEALKQLALIPPEGRMRARRLLAVAAAAQAFPELRDPDSDLAQIARQALNFQTFGGGAGDERAQGLLNLITKRLPPPGESLEALDAWWDGMLEEGERLGLLASRRELGPRPCTATTRRVPHHDRLATVIQTSFDTDLLTFEEACAFLEPAGWPDCNAFWCEMSLQPTPLAGGRRWYHEVVSLDCPNKHVTWGISAELSFAIDIDDVAGEGAAEYDIAENPPAPESPDVVVDSGSLTVQRRDDDTLRIGTTKRVLFSEEFPGEGLSLVICILGYGEVAEDFVYTCAIRDGVPDPRDPKGGPDEGSVDDLIDRATVFAKRSIDECADAARASYEKVMRREYDADALAQDLRGAFERMLRDGATAADLMAEGAARMRERRGPQR